MLENTEQEMVLEIFSVGLIKKQMFDQHFSYHKCIGHRSRLLAWKHVTSEGLNCFVLQDCCFLKVTEVKK